MWETGDGLVIAFLAFLFFAALPVGGPVVVGVLWGRRPSGRLVVMPLLGCLVGLVGMLVLIWALNAYWRLFLGVGGVSYMLAASFGTTVMTSLASWLLCWWRVSRRRRRGGVA